MRFKNISDRTVTFPDLGVGIQPGAEYQAADERQAQVLRKSKRLEEVTDGRPSKSESKRIKAQSESKE